MFCKEECCDDESGCSHSLAAVECEEDGHRQRWTGVQRVGTGPEGSPLQKSPVLLGPTPRKSCQNPHLDKGLRVGCAVDFEKKFGILRLLFLFPFQPPLVKDEVDW